jgi:predicted metal-dependent enzyme (double-stranded beta helix superfamily)
MTYTQLPALDVRGTQPARPTSSALVTLVAEIDAACGGAEPAMPNRIVAALEAAVAAKAGLLTAGQRAARTDRYARHVIHGDPAGRFTILSLVWNGCQFSPAHAHHTWCAYAVHDGTLTETVYALDDDQVTPRPLRTAARRAGYCRFDQGGPGRIHRLGNASLEPAVSLHVYGVGREHIETRVNRVFEMA